MPLISALRDDFVDNIISPVWHGGYQSGSATIAEASGQMQATLPSSTAGVHTAGYQTLAVFDLTGDGCYINIATMVATGVAAAATFQVIVDANNLVSWYQQSNTINVQKVVAGVVSGLYSAAWSSSTYKYLRIRESGGTIFFDSSTNGTSWTNRASIVGLPFAITAVAINMGASCGNVASPGSFRVEDFNLILPSLSSNWNQTTVEWSLFNRFRSITLSASSGQGYIAIANDATSRNADGTPNALTSPRYFAGPIGSLSGGYNALTEYATQAAAQAMAVNIPLNDRWDLPSISECRIIRLYHRSTTAAVYRLDEYYPRRLVQSDDIEAESIKAINIAAGTITADKIFVAQLSALSADMGSITAGTITGALIQTAASGARVALSSAANGGLIGYGGSDTYDPAAGTGTYQVLWKKTDGKLYAGAGAVLLDASGVTSIAPTSAGNTTAYKFTSGANTLGGLYGWDQGSSTIAIEVRAQPISSRDSQVNIEARYASGRIATAVLKASDNAGLGVAIVITASGAQKTIEIGGAGQTTTNYGGLNVGTGTGAGNGEVIGSGVASAFGGVRDGNIALRVQGSTAAAGRYSIVGYNSTPTLEFSVDNAGAGFLNNTAWTYSSDAAKKQNIRPLGKDIKEFMLLAPVRFDYIDGPANRWGYLAQDVQAIMPDLVEVVADGTLGLRTDEISILTGHVLRRLIRILVTKGVLVPADIA